tara:strand:+ start:866 stop:1240 length:375 start_codon:yes stop_codon:yes gene_type:complete
MSIVTGSELDVAPVSWATDACQLTVAGVDLAAAIVDSGLRVVVWRLGGGLLHRILFAQRVHQLAMIDADDGQRAHLWAVGADGAVYHHELPLAGDGDGSDGGEGCLRCACMHSLRACNGAEVRS